MPLLSMATNNSSRLPLPTLNRELYARTRNKIRCTPAEAINWPPAAVAANMY